MTTLSRRCGILSFGSMLFSAIVLSRSVNALDLPPVIPVGPNTAMYWDSSNVATCCAQTVTVYDIKATACRDFTPDEQTAQRNAFTTAYAGHCTYRGPATYVYNCHGYVFHSSAHWCADPANWEGAANPCYVVAATGPVYRWGSSHSSFAGTDYTYLGKCGREIRCDHDNTIYGAHTNRWRQR
jgi:hypothetical protein